MYQCFFQQAMMSFYCIESLLSFMTYDSFSSQLSHQSINTVFKQVWLSGWKMFYWQKKMQNSTCWCVIKSVEHNIRTFKSLSFILIKTLKNGKSHNLWLSITHTHHVVLVPCNLSRLCCCEDIRLAQQRIQSHRTLNLLL